MRTLKICRTAFVLLLTLESWQRFTDAQALYVKHTHNTFPSNMRNKKEPWSVKSLFIIESGTFLHILPYVWATFLMPSLGDKQNFSFHAVVD